MRTVTTVSKKTNAAPLKAKRPRSEMNEFGRRMADAIEKAAASDEKKLTMAEIEREVIRRRGGIYK